MLREPYNLNPYNTTIDTSLVQPFSFVFSGDKLGAYQIQVAENNSADNILYTSPLIILNPPAYNGDRVEAALPSVIQTNLNNNDGLIYYVYKLALSEDDKIWTNSEQYDSQSGTIVLTYNGMTDPFATSSVFARVGDDFLVLLQSGYGLTIDVKCEYYNASGALTHKFDKDTLTFEQYQIRIDNHNLPFGNQGNASNDPIDFTNYRIQFYGINFTITGESNVRSTVGYLYLNLVTTLNNTEAYFTDNDNHVEYFLYSSTAMASLQNLVGHDLVWRIIQWEELVWNGDTLTGAKIQNYIRNGQIIAKTGNSTFTDLHISTEIGVLTPVIENYKYANLKQQLGYIFYSPAADANPVQPYGGRFADYRLRAEIPVIDVSDSDKWKIAETEVGSDISVTNTRAWARLTGTIGKRIENDRERWTFEIPLDTEAPFAKTNSPYTSGRAWKDGNGNSTCRWCCIDGQYFGTLYREVIETIDGEDVVTGRYFILDTYNEYAVNLSVGAQYTIDVFSRQSNMGIKETVEVGGETTDITYSHTVIFTLYYPTETTNMYMHDGTTTELTYYWQLKEHNKVQHLYMSEGQMVAEPVDDADGSFNERGFWTAPTSTVTSNTIISQPIGSYFSYDSYQVSRHCFVDETARCRARLEGAYWCLYIPVTYSFTDLVSNQTKFDFAIVDNIYFSIHDITLFTDADGTQYYKTELVPTYGSSDQRYLINDEFYGYELIMKVNTQLNEFDETVTYTYYDINTSLNNEGLNPTFDLISYGTGIQVRHTLEERIIDSEDYYAYVYAQYSTGNVRGYIDGPIDEAFKVSSIYQLYSNFDVSNWTYFESRETPHVVPYYIDYPADDNYTPTLTPLPGVGFLKRAIEVTATYSQVNMIPLRYYQWIFYDSYGNILDDSGPIYDSTFKYSLSPITRNDTYQIKLITVSQNNVIVEKNTSISTDLNLDYLSNSTPEVNEEEHYATVVWDSDLSALPANYSVYDENNFGNHIGVTQKQRDFELTEGDVLVYDQISGISYTVPQDDFVFRIGFVIEDNVEEYTEENLVLFSFTNSNDVKLSKNGYILSLGTLSTNLLNPTFGVDTHNNIEPHQGQWLQWLDNNEEKWGESGTYWIETTSNTSVYYYELIIANNNRNNARVQLYRTPFQRGQYQSSTDNVTIPYNNLLIDQETVKGRFNTINGEENTVTLNNGNYINMTLNNAQVGHNEYVIYGARETLWDDNTVAWPTTDSLQSFTFSPKVYLYYTQFSQGYISTIDAPLGFAEKPSWDDWPEGSTAPFMLLDFNDTLQSHRLSIGSSSISMYEVYRVKYPSKEDAELDQNQIYNMFIGNVDTSVSEELGAAARIRFYDYTIENNGWYRYQIIPTGTINDNYIFTTPFQTKWYGWSFTSIEPEDNHYAPLNRWIYYLNLETKGYSHVTNKVFHQGFNRYPKVSIGTTDYITSNMSGLIGKFKQTLLDGYANNSYYDDNIERVYNWENFVNDGHYILVKDYKGRAYIAQLDGSTMNFQDVFEEILTTVSFNITQIDAVDNYPIFKIEGVR